MAGYSTGSLCYKTEAEDRDEGWIFSVKRYQIQVTLI